MEALKLSLVLVIISLSTGLSYSQNNNNNFSETYFGQKLPDLNPKIFAPGIISIGFSENVITFMPGGNECCWSVSIFGLETILTSKLVNGEWTKPEIAPFVGKYYDGWPAIQPDGKRLFFHSARPLPDSITAITAMFNIWYVDRINDSWIEPKIIDTGVNGAENSTCPSVTRTGTLYFSKRFNDDTEKLVRSKFVDGKYRHFEVLPDNINSMKHNFHGAISPDETFLVRPFYGRKDAIGDRWNYYVSFRKHDDTWSGLINLGEPVNSLFCGGSTSFSPDGKFLFFQASIAPELIYALPEIHNFRDLVEMDFKTPEKGSNDICWVSKDILENLKPR